MSRTSPTTRPTLPGGISPDLGYAFSNERDFGTEPIEGRQFLYLRKPDGTSELVGTGSLGSEPVVQGRYISDNGEHVLFNTGKFNTTPTVNAWCQQGCAVARLEPDSPPKGTGAIYDRRAGGPTHVVSLLPGDEIPGEGEEATYLGTSEDASSVAFRIKEEMYVRVENGEAAHEKTLAVVGEDATFAGLSSDGRYLFYVVGGDKGTIHRFDTTTEGDVEIDPGNEDEIVNVSADGSHVYFVSPLQLDGSKGTIDQPNMYVWNGGSPTFIATVLPSDLVKTYSDQSDAAALTAWTTRVVDASPTAEGSSAISGPGADSSRTTPDGTVIAFESRAQLTSYDNAGYVEIYRYEDGAEGLQPICVSCNFDAEPATTNARFQRLAWVPAYVAVGNLTADGSRIFFETDEALTAEDVDGINDVYEWEESSLGSSPHLISYGGSARYPDPEAVNSTGKAAAPNLLLAVDPDGSDVFFSAQGALVAGAGEGGSQAIYDARINGGFPASPPLTACTVEDCKPVGAPSGVPLRSASSETVQSAGNVKSHSHHCFAKAANSKDKKRGCRKPKRKPKRKHATKKAHDSSVVLLRNPGATLTDSELAGAAIRVNTSAETSAAASSPGPVVATPAASAKCSPDEFGIETLKGALQGQGSAAATTGTHPDFTTTLVFNHYVVTHEAEACAAAEEVKVALPPGLLGNPRSVPTCTMGEFSALASCPPASQVGLTRVLLGFPLNSEAAEPIYNLQPPHPRSEPARLGFMAFTNNPVYIDVGLRTAGDYGVTASIHDAPGAGVVIRAITTLWGDPSGSEHDLERWTSGEVISCSAHEEVEVACEAEFEGIKGKRPSGIDPVQQEAFMTNPSACQEGEIRASATTYQVPGLLSTASAPLTPITECTGQPFAPSFEAEPTSHVAGAPTGLKTVLKIPQHLRADERATATMREARVTLPAGMQIAAGAANWIGTCSEEQVGYHEEVDAGCPDASKLGTASILTPALSRPIEGAIYQRSPRPGHQLGLWLVSDDFGLHVKIPGDLQPDPATGRVTAVFEGLPQVPVEEIDLDVWGGPRAPLQNPDHCGSFATDFTFAPHSNDPAVTGHSDLQITEGCNQGFSPTLKAGVTDPTAGSYSPFVFDLTRPDGDQALRGFSLRLPQGEIAKVAGVPLCPDADAAAGTCPGTSRIGSLQATTGPGPEPLTIPQPGKAQPAIYFAGPYQGAPYSIVSEVPAQAGPFDLGTLAVRSALEVDPASAQVTVKADPLPQFFEGVGIAYRNVHAVVDRPQFNLNPTNCSPLQVGADATSTLGAVAHPSARFQVDGCKALGFKPKLTLKLEGGTKRAQYPALTAILTARKGDANIASASVALPHSEFLAQEHIGTICTRVQFAADTCPKGSVYGKAKAWTPLLEKPLSGPVYLRSSNHPLPDLVAKLSGQIEIDLDGRIDSIHGGIRTTFESVPDAPVSKFVLQMRGGRKSLLTNSTDICAGTHRATAVLEAQNGRAAGLRPPLQSSGCGKKKLGKHKKHH